MKKNIIFFILFSVLAHLDANAASLDIDDLPVILQKGGGSPDIGLSAEEIKQRYGKDWSNKDNVSLFSFNTLSDNQLDILAFFQEGKARTISYTSNRRKIIKISAEVRVFLIKKNFPNEKWVRIHGPSGSNGSISKNGRFSWHLSKDECQLVLVQKAVPASLSGDKSEADRKKTPHEYSFDFEALPSSFSELMLLAKGGNAGAQFRLGMTYHLRKGASNNDTEAVKWLKLSAAQGLVEAQFMLGSMLNKGIGDPKDSKASLKWFKQAASKGHPPSQLALGFMYANGQGAWRDMKAAEKWYKLAAEQGLAGAQHNLGLLYSEGAGVNHDHFAACVWLTIASKNKLELSSKELEKIYGSGRFSIANLTRINERVNKMIKENPKLIKIP